MLKLKRLTKNLLSLALVLTVSLVMSWYGTGIAKADQEEIAKREAAKKEGKLVFYTTVNTIAGEKLLKGFNERYPFVRTELYRAGGEKFLTKILTESRAKKYTADVLLCDSLDSHIIQSEGIVSKYVSPESKVYSEQFKNPDGFWTASHVLTRVLAYNTKLVSPQDVPKRYEDLLDPKWKGNLGMPDNELGWFAGLLKIMGREKGIEFMKKLSQQNMQFRVGKAIITQLLAAGEFPIAVTTNSNLALEGKRAGANIEWVNIEPVLTSLMPVMVAAHAPHPNAAMLFVDFVLSKEGQEVFRSINRIPLRPGVPPDPPRLIQGLKLLPMDPSWSGKEYYQLWRQIFSIRVSK